MSNDGSLSGALGVAAIWIEPHERAITISRELLPELSHAALAN